MKTLTARVSNTSPLEATGRERIRFSGICAGAWSINLAAVLGTLLLRAQMWDALRRRQEPEADRLRAVIALRILEAEE